MLMYNLLLKTTVAVLFVALICLGFMYVWIPMDQTKPSLAHHNEQKNTIEEIQQLHEQLSKSTDKKSSQAKHLYKLPKKYLPMENQKSPIRLLCLVLTYPKELRPNAQAVYDTWGSRCTYLYFISKKTKLPEFDLPIIHNPKEETYENLWSKTKFGFKFVYDNLLDQVDWVYKGDTDTYVVMENMHNLLAKHDPDKPTFFGSHFGKRDGRGVGGFMSGGAGYVLSREAVKMVVPAFKNPKICNVGDKGREDVYMADCLNNLKIPSGQSRDTINDEETFLPLYFPDHMDPKRTSWYLLKKSRKPKEGYSCCSEFPIAFHKVDPSMMYAMEYFFYKLRVTNISTIEDTYNKQTEG